MGRTRLIPGKQKRQAFSYMDRDRAGVFATSKPQKYKGEANEL